MHTTHVRRAAAFASGHAGEILQGALRDGGGTRRFLLSLPAPTLRTRAEVIPTPGRCFAVDPGWARKSHHAAIHLLRHLRRQPPEICIRLQSNILAGKGCGSSTADVLATMRALAAGLATPLGEEEIARLVVEVEEAADSSVLSRPALFRHREGRVEEYLPGGFPPLRVVVIDTQPEAIVDTVMLERARYSEGQFAAFAVLVKELRRAFAEGDPHRLGAVATASACISQGFLPKPHFRVLVDLVHSAAGYGLAVSHSGTVAAALLPHDCAPRDERRLGNMVNQLGMRVLCRYGLGQPLMPEPRPIRPPKVDYGQPIRAAIVDPDGQFLLRR